MALENMTVRSESVLVVDDEFLIAELLSTMLHDIGLSVCATAATADQAVALAETHVPSVVLMDVRLEGQMDGIKAANAIQQTIGAQIIFVTGSADPRTVARITRDHPAPILFKPIQLDQLRSAVLHAIA